MRNRGPAPSVLLRVLMALAVFVGSLLWVPAAVADHGDAIVFFDCPEGDTPPSHDPEESHGGCIPLEQQILRETHRLTFEVRAPTGGSIERVQLFIRTQEEVLGIPSPGQVEEWSYDQFEVDSARLSFDWDTADLTEYNSVYSIEVRASTYSPGAHTYRRERRNLRVDNLPDEPEAPRMILANEHGVSLEWSEAPDVDVEGYNLYRARTAEPNKIPANADFAGIRRVTKTDYFDEVDVSGVYWYKVQVVRRSVVDPDRGARSPLSDRSAEGGVVIKPTPAPTQPPQTNGDGGSTESRPRPRLTPRPVPRPVPRPAPVEEAPFSAVLPFDVPEDDDDDRAASFGPPEEARDRDDGSRQGLFAAAIGAFLVSSALAIGRLPS